MADIDHDSSGKWVAFHLGEEEYAISIDHVSIIERMRPITRLPQTPDFVEGVISLRGDVMPVISLRKKLGMLPLDAGDDTRIIVLQLEQGKAGLIVDAVTKVAAVNGNEIEPPPNQIGESAAYHVLGIVKQEEQMMILLDHRHLVT